MSQFGKKMMFWGFLIAFGMFLGINLMGTSERARTDLVPYPTYSYSTHNQTAPPAYPTTAVTGEELTQQPQYRHSNRSDAYSDSTSKANETIRHGLSQQESTEPSTISQPRWVIMQDSGVNHAGNKFSSLMQILAQHGMRSTVSLLNKIF